MQKLLTIFKDTNTSINFHARRKETATVEETKTFLEGRELFCVGGLYYCSELRQSETDFGILPMPKYDADQDEYNSPTIGTALTIAAVPYCNPDLESTGIFMEYFAYEGYYGLRPALYDKLLNGQIARDVESLEMLDVIFDTICYDTGLIFNYEGIADDIFKSYNALEETIMSNMVGNKKKVNDDNKLTYAEELKKLFIAPTAESLAEIEMVENEDGSQSATIAIDKETLNKNYNEYVSGISVFKASNLPIDLYDGKLEITVNEAGYVTAYKVTCKTDRTWIGNQLVHDITFDITFDNPGADITVTDLPAKDVKFIEIK